MTHIAQARDVHLTLCVTHDCNLRCRYCYAGDKRPSHMPLAVAHTAIDRALSRTSKRLHLVFFGGEPLLRWRSLVAFTAHAARQARQRGVTLHPSVTTNGTLLTGARAAWLREQQFVTAISCDGVSQAHDINRIDRAGHGSHARTEAGLRAALSEGLRVRAVLVLDPANIALLPASVSYLRELGVRDFVLNPNWSAPWSDPALLALWEQAYQQLALLYVESFRAGAPLWLSVIDSKIQTHIKGGYLASERCDLGRKDVVVAPDGRLYPCDRMVGDGTGDRFVIGHVSTGLLAPKLQTVVRAASRPPADCLGCAIVERCRNLCACANLAMTGSLDSPSELLCFHEQLSIRVADEAAGLLVAEGNEAFVRRHYRSTV